MERNQKLESMLTKLYLEISNHMDVNPWIWGPIKRDLDTEKKVRQFRDWIEAHMDGGRLRATWYEVAQAGLKIGRGQVPRVYEDSYEEETEDFLAMASDIDTTSGEIMQNTWLWEFNEELLLPPERLDVLLPLIKWCADHDRMTDYLKQELEEYYRRSQEGWLEEVMADYDLEPVRRDLLASYRKVFGKP